MAWRDVVAANGVTARIDTNWFGLGVISTLPGDAVLAAFEDGDVSEASEIVSGSASVVNVATTAKSATGIDHALWNPSNPWSGECWFQPSASRPPSDTDDLEFKMLDSVNEGWRFQLKIPVSGPPTATFAWQDGATLNTAEATLTTSDRIYHIAGVWNGTAVTMYVNGIAYAETSTPTTTLPDSGGIKLTTLRNHIIGPAAIYNGIELTLSQACDHWVAGCGISPRPGRRRLRSL